MYLKKLLRNAFVVILALPFLAAPSVASIASEPRPADVFETYTSISCFFPGHPQFGPYVKTASSGVQYPPNTRIEVWEELYADGEYVSTDMRVLKTTPAGTWNVPTTSSYVGYQANFYQIKVKVWYADTSAIIDTASWGCFMVPPAAS